MVRNNGAKIGLNAPRFNDEEKEYYVKLRQAHKLFEMSWKLLVDTLKR